jgi:hypothetical protein
MGHICFGTSSLKSLFSSTCGDEICLSPRKILSRKRLQSGNLAQQQFRLAAPMDAQTLRNSSKHTKNHRYRSNAHYRVPT